MYPRPIPEDARIKRALYVGGVTLVVALATVLGNLLVQARTLGDLPSGVSVREAARRSSHITEYTSRSAAPKSGAASFAH